MRQVLGREPVIWQAYPSWAQFSWLYLFATLAALRGGLFLALAVPGSSWWFVGAILLLGCVALVRHWARYVITSTKTAVYNGYTGREITAIPLNKIAAVSMSQGPIATLFGIGTVLIQGAEGDRVIRFRGVKDPEVVERRIQALRPVSPPTDAQGALRVGEERDARGEVGP